MCTGGGLCEETSDSRQPTEGNQTRRAMKILFVAPFVPGPNVDHAGGRDLFYLLKGLTARNEVSLLGLELGAGVAADHEALRGFCRHVEIVPLKGGAAKVGRYLRHAQWPRAVAMFYSPEFSERLKLLLRQADFDVVQLENVQTIPYAAEVSVPTVLDCIDLSFLPLFQQHLAATGSVPEEAVPDVRMASVTRLRSQSVSAFVGFRRQNPNVTPSCSKRSIRRRRWRSSREPFP